MTAGRSAAAGVLPVRATAMGLVWLGLFSLLYSFGEEIGAWPTWTTGGLSDLDLAVGFLASVAVLVALLASRASGE
jgi:hypothetical protein